MALLMAVAMHESDPLWNTKMVHRERPQSKGERGVKQDEGLEGGFPFCSARSGSFWTQRG